MNIIEIEMPGVKVIEPKVFRDGRGFFVESYNERRYVAAGIPNHFVQDNVSLSSRGILRGLHFQSPGAQGKMVSVLLGEVYDVIVDLRPDSPTFGKSYGINLSQDNMRQLWIPAGFAHGFQVTSESALFSYKCDAYYSPETEWSLLWNDPDLNIAWPIPDALLSAKDKAGQRLRDFDPAVLQRLGS